MRGIQGTDDHLLSIQYSEGAHWRPEGWNVLRGSVVRGLGWHGQGHGGLSIQRDGDRPSVWGGGRIQRPAGRALTVGQGAGSGQVGQGGGGPGLGSAHA